MQKRAHTIAAPSIALARAFAAGRLVRFWLNSGNQITGIWQAKNGKTVGAVTSSYWDSKPKAFYAIATDWSSGGMVATPEAMASYRLQRIAEFQAEAATEEACECGAEFSLL